MSTVANMPGLPPQVIAELQDCVLRIQPLMAADRFWQRFLTPRNRERLGGDFKAAYSRFGTAGMWAELRGISRERAVIEVAKTLGFLRDEDRDWLLGEIGECVDVDEAIAAAICAQHLVVLEHVREVYWNGERIEIDWWNHDKPWGFISECARHGKAGRPVDRFTFGESAHRDVVTKRKSSLTKMEAFPVDLGDRIEPHGVGTQKLNLEPQRIRVFHQSGIDTIEEWLP